jgi:hypothetical protein
MALVFLVRHAQASFGTADYDRLSDRGERARLTAALPAPDKQIGKVVRCPGDRLQRALADCEGDVEGLGVLTCRSMRGDDSPKFDSLR